MSTARYHAFVFEQYSYDELTGTATFQYSFDGDRRFTESVIFGPAAGYDKAVLDRVLRLSFLVAGTSYYKCFPTPKVVLAHGEFSNDEAALLNRVYRDGLSQFMFENNLTLNSMPTFTAGGESEPAVQYEGKGILALQSGGKDSLLLARLLKKTGHEFNAMHISSGKEYPVVIRRVGAQNVRIVERHIDTQALAAARQNGGLNGHVPVTYITLTYALIDAILHNEKTVLAAIGHEGDEPHAWIGDMPVNHQWSKTWVAEKLLANHVRRVISPDIQIGSPLRGYYELKIAELFVKNAWKEYGHDFSSCNLANYQQGHSNTKLAWCGECPKCANSFLLFAPFVEPNELQSIFGTRNLFANPQLVETFKGLLGVGGVMKPFECIGQVAELRAAYHMARARYPGVYTVPFEVLKDNFDYVIVGDSQDWTKEYATA